MFKKFFGTTNNPAPTRSRAERLANLDSLALPFTRALLLRTATNSDNAQKALFGQIDPPDLPLDLNDQIAVAISLATADILCDAMKEATGQSIFWPNVPLPKEAYLIVMFAFVIIIGLATPLQEEGHEIDVTSVDILFVNSFLQSHSLDERTKILQQASGAFVEMHQANVPQVIEWQKQVRRAAQFYVLQFTTEDNALDGQDLRRYFGTLLKSLLALLD